MMPLMPVSTVAAPALATGTPMNNNWWSGVGDFLNTGLDTWLKYEQINAAKDAGKLGQKELQETVQTPNPNPATYNQQLAQKAATGLKIGTGTLLGGAAVLALLYFMTRD